MTNGVRWSWTVIFLSPSVSSCAISRAKLSGTEMIWEKAGATAAQNRVTAKNRAPFIIREHITSSGWNSKLLVHGRGSAIVSDIRLFYEKISNGIYRHIL